MSNWSEPPFISVIVVAYKRPDLLRVTMGSLRAVTRYPNIEYILCDDGSPPEIQAEMRRIPFDQYLMAPRNEGLGANSNKGLRAAHGDFVLYLQDDWRCEAPTDFLEAAVELMGERPDVGMVRFRELDVEIPFDLHVTRNGRRARILRNGQFEKTSRYPYTDNPHLKRRSFHETLGPYQEGVPMTRMEVDFAARVERQDALRVAFIEGCGGFVHIGDEQSFNPSVKKARLKQSLLANPVTRWPMLAYLRLRGRA